MYEKKFITDAIERSASTQVDRRKMLTMFGLAGAGVAAATAFGGGAANAATIDDGDILNFALNLEYLEAEFYLRAAYGHGLTWSDTGSDAGAVHGGHKVPFKSKIVRQYAEEIAGDERGHVRFLRSALGKSAVSRPAISLDAAFTAAATAAGVIKKGQKFDAFANDEAFLLGSFLFEDVGVTAYKGAAPLIANKNYLDAAAGLLAVEAYHAGIVRSSLFAMAEKNEALFHVVQQISNARDFLDGAGDDDQGIRGNGHANITPTNKSKLAYSRTPGKVLNIVYLTPKSTTKGGFFPNGVNGTINQSANSVQS